MNFLKRLMGQAWWHTSVIPARLGQRQGGHEFKACLVDMLRSCLDKTKENKYVKIFTREVF